jgi:hypothetical protein
MVGCRAADSRRSSRFAADETWVALSPSRDRRNHLAMAILQTGLMMIGAVLVVACSSSKSNQNGGSVGAGGGGGAVSSDGSGVGSRVHGVFAPGGLAANATHLYFLSGGKQLLRIPL